ncbi:unnamed protein product [Rhizophagus irregularis]|nr:unnamed protein product [Rhizophagus irregularis]
MTPDPVVLGAVETFDIKGTMKKDIIAGDWLGIAFIDLAKQLPIEYPLTLDICTLPGVTCPITAGTVFSTTQEYTAPDELPAKYTIAVAIGRGIPPEKIVPIACSAASIGGSELSAGLDLWDFL